MERRDRNYSIHLDRLTTIGMRPWLQAAHSIRPRYRLVKPEQSSWQIPLGDESELKLQTSGS